MSSRLLLGLAALALVATAMVWQRARSAELRTRHEKLLALKAEVDRLTVENAELPALRAANRRDIGTGNELLRLRNEVRILRAQQSQIDRLQSENERLAAASGATATRSQKFSEMEGFMAKESWSNAGFASPDAALRTFFWAIRQGDLAKVAECIPPEAREHFTRLNEPGHEQERDRTLEEFRGMVSSAGIRVVTNESTAPGKATVSLQAVAGGAIMKFRLRQYGTEWKLEDF